MAPVKPLSGTVRSWGSALPNTPQPAPEPPRPTHEWPALASVHRRRAGWHFLELIAARRGFWRDLQPGRKEGALEQFMSPVCLQSWCVF